MGVVFQIYPYAIRFHLLQFCPSMALVGFAVFVLSCSADLSCYFDIPFNSMTNWPVLKLPKIAWPSLFKFLHPRKPIASPGFPRMKFLVNCFFCTNLYLVRNRLQDRDLYERIVNEAQLIMSWPSLIENEVDLSNCFSRHSEARSP